MSNCITDVQGISAGHCSNQEARTGCTVVCSPDSTAAGVEIGGSAPATLETDGLRPNRLVQTAHSIVLTGGSAYGLHSAIGVQNLLEEKQIGFDTGPCRVPIVPAAGIFDLSVGDSSVRPGPDMGREALRSASDEDLPSGQVGAGTGATVGKAYGGEYAQPGGVGTAAVSLNKNVSIGSVMVVNALGDVTSPADGEIIAGAYDERTDQFLDSEKKVMEMAEREGTGFKENTVIGVLATDMKLDCEGCCGVASSALMGIARRIRPAATTSDGDVIFVVSTGKRDAKLSIDVLKAAAPKVISRAILNAVQ